MGVSVTIHWIKKIAVFSEDSYTKISVLDGKGAVHEFNLFSEDKGKMEFLATVERCLVTKYDFDNIQAEQVAQKESV